MVGHWSGGGWAEGHLGVPGGGERGFWRMGEEEEGVEVLL